ncbi:hypothetical protein KSF78_0009470 [Schistosoma japonicum]|nr:hypothetical protein KSF78_0009470 [Schistosoma japonicum]
MSLLQVRLSLNVGHLCKSALRTFHYLKS